MISYLKGTILRKDLRFVIVDIGGLGYKVATTAYTLSKIAGQGKETALWTHLAVRENALDLYGFLSEEELDFFELLITISGIGPKTALGILNAATIDTLKNAIISGDASHLTKVSGIGKKNADKIVMELKDKVGAFENGSVHLQNESDVMEALTSLGYSHLEIREALKKIPKDISDTGAKIKAALKIIK